MANTDIKQSFKEYLSSTDRFTARLKASMRQNNTEIFDPEQQIREE
jgi:hypothetical protein